MARPNTTRAIRTAAGVGEKLATATAEAADEATTTADEAAETIDEAAAEAADEAADATAKPEAATESPRLPGCCLRSVRWPVGGGCEG